MEKGFDHFCQNVSSASTAQELLLLQRYELTSLHVRKGKHIRLRIPFGSMIQKGMKQNL